MPKSPPTKRSARAAVSAPGHPPNLQVGALCWRRTPAGVLKVLLISSRDTGRWIVPKGWPMRKRTEAGAAAREAYEEAGVRGTVAEAAIGVYAYRKRLGKGMYLPCIVRVYAIEVAEMLRKYPETGQRKIRWFSAPKAAGKVLEPDLAALIRSFDPGQTPR